MSRVHGSGVLAALMAVVWPLLAAADPVRLKIGSGATSGRLTTSSATQSYVFTVAQAAVYTIDTRPGTLADTTLALYDSATNLMARNDNGGAGNMAQIVRGLQPGDYVVTVGVGFLGGSGTYSIQVSLGAKMPVVNSLAVSSGSARSTIRAVTLPNDCAGDPTLYEASESAAFTDATWQVYSAAPGFLLSFGDGAKIVYFRVKDDAGLVSATKSVRVTLAEAPPAVLPVNSPGYFIGSIAPAGDADWYAMTIASQDVYTVDTQAGTLADDFVSIYGPGNQTNLLAQTGSGGLGKMAQLTLALDPGTYYLQVRAEQAAGTGTYLIRFTSGTAPAAISRFVIDNGAVSTAARDVTLNAACAGAPAAQCQASEAADFRGAPWQPFSSRLPFLLSPGNGTKTVYFRVRDVSSNVSAAVQDTIVLSEAAIATLAVNGPAYTGNVGSVGAANRYQFTVPYAGVYTIDTTAGTLTGDRLALYGPDSLSVLVGEATDGGVGGMAQLVLPLAPGVYYVYVRGTTAYDLGTYAVRVTSGSAQPTVTRFAINNGAFTTVSRTVTLDNASVGAATDYEVSESVSFAGASWQSYGVSPAYTLQSAGNGVKTVYFRVRNASGLPSATVQDQIVLNEPLPVTLMVGAGATAGNIGATDETDLFAFSAATAGAYKLDLLLGTLPDGSLFLYGPGSSTNLLAHGDTGGSATSVHLTPTLAVGTYTAKVRALRSSDTGTYSIRVSR